MKQLIWVLSTLLFFVSCSFKDSNEKTSMKIEKAKTLLKKDFLLAREMTYSTRVDLKSRRELKKRLHYKLQSLGDNFFSEVLAEQVESIQISVVNMMGFFDPKYYNKWPKTKYILASSPKM